MPRWDALGDRTFARIREAACDQCDFSFDGRLGEVLTEITNAPARYAAAVRGRDARRPPAPGVWSPSAYVWHVADALRAWAERLAVVREHPGARIVPFDQDELARVRRYEELPIAGGLYALGRAVAELDACLRDIDPSLPLDHPEFGPGTVEDAVRWLAHEVHHHEMDIEWGLRRTERAGSP